nr:hypothetical protein [Tanacetum cinerariifolium]
MGRDTVQLETFVSTISQEYLLEFTSEYGISEDLHLELPDPEERIVDFSEGKVEMPARDTYSAEAVTILNTHRTPIQKQPETLMCLVDMDLFNLIRAANPTKAKTDTRPCAAHEVLLLTVTASRVIEMEDPATVIDSFEVPPPENIVTMGVALEAGLAEESAAMGPHAIKKRRKRGNDGVDTSAPPKVLRRDHVEFQPTQSTIRGKSLPVMEIEMRDTPVDVSDPDPLSLVDPQSIPTENVAQSSKGAAVARDPKSEHTSFTSMVGSPERIYQPEWGVTIGCRLDAPEACQDLVDHIAPPGQVAMGSQLRLRFEQEEKLLKRSVAQVARRDQRIQARENEIKNLKALLEAETDMKKTAEAKSTELEEKLKAAFKEFKQFENNRVEKHCADMNARLDALSIDFDEELYPHMLTAISSRRWVVGHGLHLAVMNYGESIELRQVFVDVVSARIAKGMSEGMKYVVEHGRANLDLEVIEAYDPEANVKYVAALHTLRDLKYPMVDQLERLKDAPIDVIMASLHLESNTEDDAPPWIHELRLSSSQLKIPMYPEIRNPQDPGLLKKRYCWRMPLRPISDGDQVSVPTLASQGLAILLTDAATQTETSEDGGFPRICTGSVLCAPWESSRMHPKSWVHVN